MNQIPDIEEYTALMGDYLDGDLHGQKLATFEKLLDNNTEFRRSFLQYQATVAAVKGLPHQQMSEFGRARLRRTLQKEQKQQPVIRWVKPMSYAAAAMLLMSVGFLTGQQFGSGGDAAVYQAMPAPNPLVRLRDADTGDWLDVDAFADQVKRTRHNYAIVPQLRISADKAQQRLSLGQTQVQQALKRHQIDAQSVRFFTPVKLNENPLDGPEVEFWVQRVGINAGN